MKFKTQILISKGLSDIRTILFFVVLASVLSSVIAYAAGYESGVRTSRDYFFALVRE